MRPRTPEQLWALSRRLYRSGWPRLAKVVKTLNWLLHKCLLPSEAIVGDNVLLEHYAMGIVIHPQTTIGNNCRIFHNVTMAAETHIGSEHRILIEDNVTIGVGAIIMSRPGASLTIGEGSTLGAGSVLIKDIPPHEIWAGNPARKIKDAARP